MKISLSFFVICIISSCSTSKQLNNKWVGKTDQDVVNEYGMPNQVLGDSLKGKIYLYKIILNGSAQVRTKNGKDIEIVNYTPPVNERINFHFDSINKVRYVVYADSFLKGKPYIKK